MKKNIIIIIVLLIFINIGNTKAQNLVNYNLSSQNNYLYNPAYSIDTVAINVFLNSHLQWIGFEGAPKTNTFGVNGAINKSSGVGLSVVSNSLGALNNFNMQLSYAYRAKFADNHYLQMGAAAGFLSDQMSDINQYADMTDNVIINQDYNGMSFSANAGLAYFYNSLEVQFVMPQLYQRNEMNLYSLGAVAYDYKVNSKWNVKPAVMVRGAKVSPIQYDAKVMGTWNQTAWLEAGYRSNNSMVVGVGANIKSLGIGYAYQSNSSAIAGASSGTHEIQLLYRIGGESLIKKAPKTDLTGKVSNIKDNNIIASKVTITDEKGDTKILETDATTGQFNVKLKSGKSYTIEITSDEYYPTKQTFTLGEDETEKSITYFLTPLKAEVNGYLSSVSNSRPVKDAKIVVMSNGTQVAETKTDNAGKFNVELPSENSYKIIASSDNYIDGTVSFDIPKEKVKQDVNVKIEPLVNLSGKITDFQDGSLLKTCIIGVYKDSKFVERIETNGNYNFFVEKGSNYTLEFETPDYLVQKERINLKTSKKYEVVKNVKMQKMENKLEFGNIEFKTGTSELTADSYVTLDQLVTTMQDNASIRIEISGHTDNVGTAAKNKEISQERADICSNYLISKGIKTARISSKGHGESIPLVPNTTEANKAKNRRVEFKIID